MRSFSVDHNYYESVEVNKSKGKLIVTRSGEILVEMQCCVVDCTVLTTVAFFLIVGLWKNRQFAFRIDDVGDFLVEKCPEVRLIYC